MLQRHHRTLMGLRTVLAGALTMGLLLGQAAAAQSRYPEKEHLPVDYSEMVMTGFDSAALEHTLEELRALCASSVIHAENPELRQHVLALYEQIVEEIDCLVTQYHLAEIRSDADVLDQKAVEDAAVLSAQYDQWFDACYGVLRMLLDTPYQDIVESDAGEHGLELLRGYRQMSPREFALSQEEARLVTAYDQYMAQPVQVTVDGQTWTEETLYEARELDDDAYFAILSLLEQEENRGAGEIFLQLLQVRTEIAQEAGYENYADYAYQEIYNRDYTAKDIQSVCQDAKTYLTPLDARMRGLLDAKSLRALEVRTRSTGEEILDAIQPYLKKIDPELAEVCSFLRTYHLYDIERSDDKLPVGYTVPLPAYGSAFIFNSPYGDYEDYGTTVHEFGHFNETFRSTQGTLWSAFNIDVGEIHSQGLEVLFAGYAEDLFGSNGRTFYWSTLSNMVDSVLEGCMYDEFQNAVYRDPEMTLEEMNRLFKTISEQYGYIYEDGQEEGYFWVEITHNFQNPMYYISYATSALSAVDLWQRSLGDRREAVEIYMDLTVLGMSKPYRAAIGAVGLSDVFQPGVIQSLAEELEARMEADYAGDSKTVTPTGLLISAGSAVLATSVLLFVGKRRKAAAAQLPEKQL